MRKILAVMVALVGLTGDGAAQSWQLVKPDGLGFEAELPGKPEYSETTDDLGDGETGMIRTYVVKSPVAAYDVTVWDLPKAGVAPEDVGRVLDNMRDRTLSGLTAKLRTETKIEISGREARDVTADVMGMVWRGRAVIAGNRLYQIVAIISKDAERSAETERYFASFKLDGTQVDPKK